MGTLAKWRAEARAKVKADVTASHALGMTHPDAIGNLVSGGEQ